jgi:hypothetical protein
MMIANCKRSKRSSPCRLESFSLTGWTRSRFGMRADARLRGSSPFGPMRPSRRRSDPQFEALLLRRGENDSLALHLVDNGFGAFAASGGELGGLARECLKLLT